MAVTKHPVSPAGTKVCTKCQQEKPVSDFSAYATGRKAGNYRPQCRECQRAYEADWTARNREKARKADREHRRKNPDTTRARQSRHYYAHQSEQQSRSLDWYYANRERCLTRLRD